MQVLINCYACLASESNIIFKNTQRNFQFLILHIKSLEALHSILTNRMLNRQENQQLYLNLRERRAQGTSPTPGLEREATEYRESQLTGGENHDQESQQEAGSGGSLLNF